MKGRTTRRGKRCLRRTAAIDVITWNSPGAPLGCSVWVPLLTRAVQGSDKVGRPSPPGRRHTLQQTTTSFPFTYHITCHLLRAPACTICGVAAHLIQTRPDKVPLKSNQEKQKAKRKTQRTSGLQTGSGVTACTFVLDGNIVVRRPFIIAPAVKTASTKYQGNYWQ